MYARLVMFTLEEGNSQFADEIAQRALETMQGLKGFKKVIFFADENINEYGALSLWETKQDALSADAALAPNLMKALQGIVQRMPVRRVIEAWEGVPELA